MLCNGLVSHTRLYWTVPWTRNLVPHQQPPVGSTKPRVKRIAVAFGFNRPPRPVVGAKEVRHPTVLRWLRWVHPRRERVLFRGLVLHLRQAIPIVMAARHPSRPPRCPLLIHTLTLTPCPTILPPNCLYKRHDLRFPLLSHPPL